MAGWVYILASAPYGTLYVGVTADLPRRAFEHRDGIGSELTRKYGVQKRLKKWNWRWKIDLIERDNPGWDDLYARLNW